jgi:hypothetical protein
MILTTNCCSQLLHVNGLQVAVRGVLGVAVEPLGGHGIGSGYRVGADRGEVC